MDEPALWIWLDSSELPTGITIRGLGAGLPLALWCAWMRRQEAIKAQLDGKKVVAH